MEDLGKKEVESKGFSKKETVWDILVPSSIFKDRKLSPLEALIEYLRENERLRFREIAKILNRDERNVWTVYMRAKKKRNG